MVLYPVLKGLTVVSQRFFYGPRLKALDLTPFCEGIKYFMLSTEEDMCSRVQDVVLAGRLSIKPLYWRSGPILVLHCLCT